MPEQHEPDEWAVFDADESIEQPTKKKSRPTASARNQERQASATEFRRESSRSPGVILVAIVLVGLVVFILSGVLGGSGDAEAEKVPLLKPGQSSGETTPPADEGFPRGDGPQAVETNVPTLEREPADIPAPTKPTAEPDDPESVTSAWATAYLSRINAEAEEWKDFLPQGTAENLVAWMEEQSSARNFPLAGKWPTTVTDVRIKDAEVGAPVDTPVRWSRNADVDVLAADGSTTTITFALTLYQGENGWVVTNIEQKFWVVK